MKTWHEVIKSDLKEKKVNIYLAKYRNACKSFIKIEYDDDDEDDMNRMDAMIKIILVFWCQFVL